MPRSGGISKGGLRRRAARVLLAASAAAGAAAAAGCGSVEIEPAAEDWFLLDDERAPQAAWSADDVEILVPLRYEADATHVVADVRNGGDEAAWIEFAVPPGSSARLALGDVSGGPPTFVRPWSERLFPGRPIEVPPGPPGSPGTIRLALLPGARWSRDDPPRAGSRILFELTLSTRWGDVPCRFWFRVTRSPSDGWSGMTEAGQFFVILLIAAVATAVVLWAG